MNHQTGRAIQVCSSVVFKFCFSEDCDAEENDEKSHSDAEESSGITTATNSSTGKAGVVLLLVIIVFKGEGSEWVICSISKLMELACGKCQEVNCAKTRQVAYEVTGCCLQINGVCQDGHRFN